MTSTEFLWGVWEVATNAVLILGGMVLLLLACSQLAPRATHRSLRWWGGLSDLWHASIVTFVVLIAIIATYLR